MDEVLFYKTVAVTIKTPERDGSSRQGRVSVHVVAKTMTSPVHRTELQVRLTCEDDAFFLYTLHLSEEDFQTLKTQQGLLVDFTAFPQKFIDLLQLCLHSEASEQPKFLLHFVGDSQHGCALLSIVEANPFKHLTHLSLRFVAGNDTAVKKYLAECLSEANEQNAVLRERFSSMENDLSMRLSRSDETLKSRTVELESLRAEWTSHTNSLISKHTQELAAEREKSLQALTESQRRIEEDKRDAQRCYQTKAHDYETKIGELQATNKELTEHKYKAESTIHELKTRLSSSEEECQRLQQDLQTLRTGNSTLDATCHDRDKTIHQLKTRLAVLEQEIKDKEDVVSRTSSMLQTTSEQKVKAEGLLEQRERDVAKSESTVKSLSSEVMKGNEIIRRLQSELKSYKDKVKLKSVVTTKQEMLIREKDNVIERQTHEMAALKLALKERNDETTKLRESLTASEARLEEKEQHLKTNENVIAYLNHQINERLLEQPSFPVISSRDVIVRPFSSSSVLAPTAVDHHRRKPLATHPLANHSAGSHITGGQHKVTFKSHLHKSGIPVPSAVTNSGNPTLPTVLEKSPPFTQEYRPQPITTSPSSAGLCIDPKYLVSTSPVITASVPSRQSTVPSVKKASPEQISDGTTGIVQRTSPDSRNAVRNTLAVEQMPRCGPPPSATGQPPLLSAYFPH